MNRHLALLAITLLAAFPLACDSSSGGGTAPNVVPTNTPACPLCTPTFTPTPPSLVTVSYGGSDNFSPASLNLSAGGSVIWNNSFGTGTSSHTLYVDNGDGSTCSGVPAGHGYPATVAFPTAGTYKFHCSIHSSCDTSTCSSCTGMVGIVVVH